jgi:hypothetical protein
MEYLGFMFGVFGLMAYFEVSSLKKRVTELERELTAIRGTSYHEDRNALLNVVKSYIGEKVHIDLKEDHEDVDILSYGNTKHGSNTIVDADGEWILVHIESPKGDMDKLIRMESIDRISIMKK